MARIEANGVQLTFTSEAEADIDGVPVAPSDLTVARDVERDGSRVRVRVRLTNSTDRPVSVRSLTPVVIRGLSLGGAPVGDWIYLREPRKKNDMPACIRLGSDGPGIFDAVRGTMETGGWDRREGDAPLPHRFVSSELTVLRGGEASLTIGVLPLDRQLVQSVLSLSPDRESFKGLRVDCQCDGQLLAPGGELASQWVLLDTSPHTWAAIERYTQDLMAMQRPRRLRDQRPPSVWCSWYYYGDGFSQAECEPNLAALEQRPLPIDVVQIDECWDLRWGDWRPNHAWPGLAGIAQRIRALGYEPGIWTCPFLAESRARTRYENPEWLLRNAEGKPIEFPMNAMQNLVLDPTHPEVLAFIEELYRYLVGELGFTYHKLDFTRAAGDPDAVFHDRAKSRAEAYVMGMEAVRRGAGESAYINVCGGFYGPALGIADAQRTGSDVKSLWPTAPVGEEADGYGPFTIKQNTLRFWMNRLWHNDPDALMVRRRPEAYRDEVLSLGMLTDDEALTCALNQYLGGGLVCFTENLAEIDDDRLMLLRHCSPSLGEAAVPIDWLDAPRFPAVLETTVTPATEALPSWRTISVVNWFDEPRTLEIDVTEDSVASAFSGRWTRIAPAGETLEIGPVPPHGCEVVKLQPAHDGPMLLRTNGHFSMGGAEVVGWEPFDGGVRLTVDWPWPTTLELQIAPPSGSAMTATVVGPTHGEIVELTYG